MVISFISIFVNIRLIKTSYFRNRVIKNELNTINNKYNLLKKNSDDLKNNLNKYHSFSNLNSGMKLKLNYSEFLFDFSSEFKSTNKEINEKIEKAKENLINNKETNAIKIIQKIDNKEIKFINKLDYAKFLNLKGYIYMENGYNSKALTNLNLASLNFKEISQDPYDPFLINNMYDEIIGNILYIENFEEVKDQLFDLISVSLLLENNYLIFKGYTCLTNIYNISGNYRRAFILAKYTLELMDKKKFTSSLLQNKLICIYLINLEIKKSTIKSDYIIKKINSENGNFIVNKLNKKEIEKNETNINEISKELSVFKNPLFSSIIFYSYSDYYYNKRNYYSSLYCINLAIENSEQNDLKDLNYILFYVKKWSILINMGREDMTDHIMEHSQKLINQFYNTESIKNLDYLRYISMKSSNIDPPRQDIVNEILRKTGKLNDYNNLNALLQKFYNLICLINIKSGVPEIIEIYKEFDILEKKIFKNFDNELLFDLKNTLRLAKLKAVYQK